MRVIRKTKKAPQWPYWLVSILLFGGSGYLVYQSFYASAPFVLLAALIVFPPIRIFLKKHHYNANALIGIPVFCLVLAGIFGYLSLPGESDIPSLLKEFKPLSGSKVNTFQDMSFRLDPALHSEEKEGSLYYYPVASQSVPVLVASKEEGETIKNLESLLTQEVQKQLGINATILDIIDEDRYVNGRESKLVSYNIHTKKGNGLLSGDLVGQTFLVPIEGVTYTLSFYTYKNDFNEYDFSDVVNTIDLYALTHYLDVQEEMNNYLKKHACPEKAYPSECDQFNTYRAKLKSTIDNEGSIEEMESAKEEAVRYENEVKGRIQKDQEEMEYLKTIGAI